MAITGLDGVIAGMLAPADFLKVRSAVMEAAGIFTSLAYETGMPGAMAAPAPGMAGVALTTYDGQIPFSNPQSGYTYLTRFSATANTVGRLLLLDRLWHNSGIVVTTTTAQTINSATWPARDRLETINGNNIFVAIEVRTATTNASAITNTVMSYTNTGGTASQIATVQSFPATAVAGTFVPFQLAAGDTGIKSIQTITLGTSYVGGAIHLVAYRILADLDLAIVYAGNSFGVIGGGLVRLFNNSVPFLVWLPSGTAATTIMGKLVYTQG